MSGNPGLSCARCHEICEGAERPFVCQAREPCRPLSEENLRALDLYTLWRALDGPMALGLMDLVLTPAQLLGLRTRLMACVRLWPK